MNLVNYILHFLEEVKIVTIPRLGVFKVKHISSVAESGTLIPPSQKVVFSQQHDLNNDNIVKLIASFEELSLEETQRELDKMIEEWKDKIKEQGNLELPRLGKLFADKEKINFEMSKDCSFKYKNFGLPLIKIYEN